MNESVNDSLLRFFDPDFVDLDLLRKKSEHNEGILSTLEEISLH